MKKSILQFSSSTIALTILALSIFACSSSDSPDHKQSDPLRISVLPDQNPEQLNKRYKPLFDYISSTTGLTYVLTIPKTYQQIVDDLKNNKTDFAYLGGYTFTLSHINGLTQPLVMRDIDLEFTSSLIVHAKSTATKITDLDQKSFAFGSKLSTSGHLMPRYYLQEKGIIPEKFFSSIKYSGAHDKTAFMVRDRVVSAGIMNSQVLKKMLTDGRLTKQDIKILWQTPPHPNYVWAVSSRVSDTIKNKLKKAMLQLVYSNPEHKIILDGLSARAFFPASPQDFSILRSIINDSQKN